MSCLTLLVQNASHTAETTNRCLYGLAAALPATSAQNSDFEVPRSDITFYRQESNRLGEANVLRGVGDLEIKLGRNEQARTAYDEAAQLFGSLGMMNYRDEAYYRASQSSFY